MKKFIYGFLVGLMIVGSIGTTNVLASTENSVYRTVLSSGYEIFEGVSKERTIITNPVATVSISSGSQRGMWTRGVTSTHVVSETVSLTGQGRASITLGSSGQNINAGWRPINVNSSAMAPRSPLGFTDRAYWDLMP